MPPPKIELEFTLEFSDGLRTMFSIGNHLSKLFVKPLKTTRYSISPSSLVLLFLIESTSYSFPVRMGFRESRRKDPYPNDGVGIKKEQG